MAGVNLFRNTIKQTSLPTRLYGAFAFLVLALINSEENQHGLIMFSKLNLASILSSKHSLFGCWPFSNLVIHRKLPGSMRS